MDEQSTGQPAPDPASPGTGGSAPQPAEDALRALALRLLSPRYPFQPAPAHVPALLVGSMPDPLPFAVPLPAPSQVVGSLVRDDAITIVLDCNQNDAQVMDFYRERMEAQGWLVPGQHHAPHGGFAFGGGAPVSYIQLCRGDRMAGLRVMVLAREGLPTDVRLELEAYSDPRHSPCAQQPPPHFIPNVLPVLIAPAGALQHPEGGGAGSDAVHSSATVATDLDLAALVAHFDQQLEKGRWTRSAGGIGGPAGWSTWTLKDAEDQPWRGLLLVLQQPDAPRQYFLMVRATRVGESAPGPSSDGTWGMSSMSISAHRTT